MSEYLKMKEHLGYLEGEYVVGWIQRMDYKVQYWEIYEHDNGTWLFVIVGHSVTSTQRRVSCKPVFSNRRAVARNRALTSIISGRERFSWN